MLNLVGVAMETFVRLTAYPPTLPSTEDREKKKKAYATN